MEYVVFPGEGRVSPNSSKEYIDAGTLAALYGLNPGDYTVGTVPVFDTINLFPRLDGKYKSIKKRLGDNGQRYHLDTPAFFHKSRDNKTKNSRVVQEQYLDSFRDDGVERDKERVL